jgi:lipoate-protein ligase A
MGNTNYSIMMPREVFDRRTNVELICRALQELDIPAVVNERHDITLDEKKIGDYFVAIAVLAHICFWSDVLTLFLYS